MSLSVTASPNLNTLAPAFAQAFDRLAQVPALKSLNESLWLFSLIETFHLLAMAVLGGAVLVLNLRLLGVALQQVPPGDVERATRPWLWLGIAGTIATGTVMALATAVSTLASAAFVVKMVALVAAILFSLAVSREVRRGTATGRGPQLLAVAAVLLWAMALLLFATTQNLGGGALLVAVAGFVLFAALTPGRRLAYALGVGSVLAVGLIGSLLAPATAEGDALAHRLSLGAVGVALAYALAVWLLARKPGAASPAQGPARLTAFACTLAWVTAAAAGRWIGFS